MCLWCRPSLRLFSKLFSVSARSLVCDGCVCEGRSMSSRQDNLQEDLGGAASLHPGRATDGFWLNTNTYTHTHTESRDSLECDENK